MTMQSMNGNSHPLLPSAGLDELESERENEEKTNHRDPPEEGEGVKAGDYQERTELRDHEETDDEMFPDDEDEGRPTIDVKKPLNRIVDFCVRLLAKEPLLFQKHNELVQVVVEEDGRVKPRQLKNAQTRYRLAKRGRWVKGGEPVHPPEHVAKCIIERTAWERIPALRAVTHFPAMNAEGWMPNEAGYDPSTKTYFTGEVAVKVPAAPTQEDARNAVATLRDIVSDFPFANKENDEHFSAWTAGLLTPLARYAHDGNAPLVLVQANGPRIGKTTLVKLISEIVMGVPCPVITFTRNEDETRKRILSFLRVARGIVLVDNIIGQFGGQNVNALTTSRSFEDRVLGKSVIVEALNDTSWYVTGNNIMLAADTAERCLNVRLESSEEKPHLRTDFKYPFLFEAVREKRAELLSAALTVLKAYIVAGKPDQKLPSWGGFEAWSRIVRGSVHFAGLPDPGVTRLELEEQADVETDEKSALVVGLAQLQERTGQSAGFKASEILDQVRTHPDRAPDLRAVLEDLSGMAGQLPDSKTLARHLREAVNRNFHGLVLVRTEDAKAGHRWRVEHVQTKANSEEAA